MARKFNSARKLRPRRKSKQPGQAAKKRNANNYRPTDDQRDAQRIKRYVEFQGDHPRNNLLGRELRYPVGCGTILGGKKVWQRGVANKGMPNQQTYSFPIIIDGRKCNEPALSSKRVEGKTVYRCAAHQGVDWIE